ncbi:C1QTNF4 [Branchiostoma lanceolatum]|uniref:C1QTNF4 protein n=1 Tax=Branchiostoma lanceolatum TaxID=7740 RepID=A0A8K0EJH9_BRALA|nr:C1QTNF4 [Branchiostoma lanceolatum]
MAPWTLQTVVVCAVLSAVVGTGHCAAGCSCSQERVAFTLTRSTNEGRITGYNDDLVVTFDHVISDVGGSFAGEKNPSVFTCAVPGAYMFSFTALAQKHHSAYIKLLKNGEFQTALWAGRVQGNHGSGSSTAVLHLRTGDRVWLAIGSPGYYGLHSNENRFATFTGVLLYPD